MTEPRTHPGSASHACKVEEAATTTLPTLLAYPGSSKVPILFTVNVAISGNIVKSGKSRYRWIGNLIEGRPRSNHNDERQRERKKKAQTRRNRRSTKTDSFDLIKFCRIWHSISPQTNERSEGVLYERLSKLDYHRSKEAVEDRSEDATL